MNRSRTGLPVHHQLPEFTQTHVHRVGGSIQPSHPLSSPSPAPNPSQHQGLFQWVNSSHDVAKVLEFQPQHQFFQWTPRTDLLQDGLVGPPCSPRDSQESSPGGRSQDGGLGWGDHFLSYKFIERTIERWTNFTKQLLITSRGHQAPRKASHCLRREVGQNIKDKKRDKRAGDRDPSREGSLNRGSFQTPGNPSTGGSGGSFQI